MGKFNCLNSVMVSSCLQRLGRGLALCLFVLAFSAGCAVMRSVDTVCAECGRSHGDFSTLPDCESASYAVEAKAFFERTLSYNRVNNDSLDAKNLTPGAFVPDWSKAVVKKSNRMMSLNVPISAEYLYSTKVLDLSSGNPRTYTVPVHQVLIIIKGAESRLPSIYIMSIIPSWGCFVENADRLDELFYNNTSNPAFSGIVIYNYFMSNYELYCVYSYIEGRFVEEASVFEKKNSREENVAQMYAALRRYEITRHFGLNPRFEEGDWRDAFPDGKYKVELNP